MLSHFVTLFPAMTPSERSDHMVKDVNDLYSRLRSFSNLKQLALHLDINNQDLDAAERDNPNNMEDLNLDICDLLYRRHPELSWHQILNYIVSKDCRMGWKIAEEKDINVFSTQAYQEHCGSTQTEL